MGEDFSVFQEHRLVQHRFHILDEVGGEDDRGIPAVVGEDGVQDVIPCRRVHAADGFIQQIEPGVPAHGEDELDASPYFPSRGS